MMTAIEPLSSVNLRADLEFDSLQGHPCIIVQRRSPLPPSRTEHRMPEVVAADVFEVRSRAAGRVPPLTWLLLLLSLSVGAITLVLALVSPPGEPVLIATRRIAVVRTSTGREAVSGVSPVLRATPLIAMMRLDLVRLTEQQFLAEWGDQSQWKHRFTIRERQARR
jgi:hypothetical protein